MLRNIFNFIFVFILGTVSMYVIIFIKSSQNFLYLNLYHYNTYFPNTSRSQEFFFLVRQHRRKETENGNTAGKPDSRTTTWTFDVAHVSLVSTSPCLPAETSRRNMDLFPVVALSFDNLPAGIRRSPRPDVPRTTPPQVVKCIAESGLSRRE